MEKLKSLEISLDYLQKGLVLYIDERIKGTVFNVSDAKENNEAENQLVEGFFYDYTFSIPRFSFADHPIVQSHSRYNHLGTLSPNTFVGTVQIPIISLGKSVGAIELEVQSKKIGYRDDYRVMLEFITEKCTDLLMLSSSPISQYFEQDYTSNSSTLYQKFAFVKSIISTDEFTEAVHRIITFPNTRWSELDEEINIKKLRKIGSTTVKQIAKGKKRTHLPSGHFLRASYGISSLPDRLPSVKKIESIDTPENRFVKHVLEVLFKFCSDINRRASQGARLEKESFLVMKKLEGFLHHSFFNEVSQPQSLSINSPILQRKEGYREILRVWLMFDLAAKLIWSGGEEIYEGGKKDIAVLYEYWLFFQLLDLFHSIFNLEPKSVSELIEPTKNGLDLKLKQGNYIALSGIYSAGNRRLSIRFSYNRIFGGKKEHPSPGSWTTQMRPDYTLSIWPAEHEEETAEEKEVIVHIHFDAKYKVANLLSFIDQENGEQKKKVGGIYKNSDLLKMHAYKDAIRRTGGAYVLYPGHKSFSRRGFHEILPGLGAFPVRPMKGDDGIGELRNFIKEVLNHMSNHDSQREKLAAKKYEIFKKKDD